MGMRAVDLQLKDGVNATTSGTTGNAVDTANNNKIARAVILSVAVTGTGGATVKLQESDTSGGTYTDIPNSTINIASSGTGMVVVPVNKRFVKAVAQTVGASTTASMHVFLTNHYMK